MRLAAATLLALALASCSLLASFDRAGLDPCGGDAGDGGGDADVDGDADPDAGEDADRDADGDDADGDGPSPGPTVIVTAGEHAIGAPPEEVGYSVEDSRRLITLTRAFEVRVTEVTQGEFLATMGYDPSEHSHLLEASPCTALCPVEGVSWHEAAAYCNALSSAEGLSPCYECDGVGRSVRCTPAPAYATPFACPGYRLPTEAEWEVAARGGDLRGTYNGDLDVTEPDYEARSAVLDPIAWYSANSDALPHEVARLQPNAWGLYDVLGNVAEWCTDWLPDYSTIDATDPTLPCTTQCGQRGAHYGTFALYVRFAQRGVQPASEADSGAGFRTVRSR